MILLVLVAFSFFVSLLLGGRLERLGGVHFRGSYLVLIALGIQVLAFSRWWREELGYAAWSKALYILSMLLLLAATWLNRRVAGIIPLAAGLLLNAVVILANGGQMPTSLQALEAAGLADSHMTLEPGRASNSSLIGDNTLLWFLGDVFAIPQRVPLANVFSVGDVLIAVGAAWFVWANMRRPSKAT